MNIPSDTPIDSMEEPAVMLSSDPEYDEDSQAALVSRLAENQDESCMEAVRMLIFGKRSKEIDDQFQQISDRLGASVTALEEKMRRRFDNVEEFIRGEIISTNQRVDSTRSDLEQHGTKTGERMDGLGQALRERFLRLEKHVDELEKETRSSIFEQSKALTETIESEVNRLTERIDHEIADLGEAATHRSHLGESLIEMALRIDPESGRHLNTAASITGAGGGSGNGRAVPQSDSPTPEERTAQPN